VEQVEQTFIFHAGIFGTFFITDSRDVSTPAFSISLLFKDFQLKIEKGNITLILH